MNHLPLPDDAVQAWLEQHRDAFTNHREQQAIQVLIDDYKIRAADGIVMEAPE